jgi:hypothetical protein
VLNEIKGRDEDTAPLDEALKLPARYAPHRAQIEGPPAPFAG